MIDHVSLAVSDLAVSRAFYRGVLETIGLNELVLRETTVGFGKKYAELWINARPGMDRVDEDAGAHVCLRASSESAVTAFHEAAIALGGTDAGAPGGRRGALGPYFGAFIYDPDGNKIEALTFPRSEAE